MIIWADVCCSKYKWPLSSEWLEYLEEVSGLVTRRDEAPYICVCSDGVLVLVPSWFASVDVLHWVTATRNTVDTYPDLEGIYEILPVHKETMDEIEASTQTSKAAAS